MLTGSANTHAKARRRLRQRLEADGYPRDEIVRRVEELRAAQGRQVVVQGTGKPTTNRQRAVLRDQRRCRYCGVQTWSPGAGGFPPDMLTIDHVRPRSKGGTNELSNLVVACRACNHQKGDRTPGEAGMTLLEPGTLVVFPRNRRAAAAGEYSSSEARP